MAALRCARPETEVVPSRIKAVVSRHSGPKVRLDFGGERHDCGKLSGEREVARSKEALPVVRIVTLGPERYIF